jgi:hypothetical protein
VRVVSAAATASRFPPPWSVEELDACFIVKDSAGQKWRLSITKKNRGGDRRPSWLSEDEASESGY